MRLCIINEFFHPDETGGTGTVLSGLARRLRQDHPEVEIDVITSRNLYRGSHEPLPAREDWDGVRIFRLGTPRPNGKSTAGRLGANAAFGAAALLKLWRMPRYDLVLVGTAPPTVAFVAQAYQRLTGTPYAYIVYDLEPDRAVAMGVLPADTGLTRALHGCQHAWLHSAARVVVLGRCMREHLTRAYGLSPEQVAVIPIGADPEEILPRHRETRFRAAHGLTGFLVCYSGNFGRYHNFDTILDAARELARQRRDITFCLVGDGAQREHIAARVAAEDIANVRLFPFVPKDEYPDLLASADASLVTLEPGMEGLCVPSKFYSILASGRATIAMVSPGSEVAQVIEEERCGVQIALGDTDTLVRTLARLSDRPAEAAAMGRNARHALVHRYSLAAVTDQYHALMREIVAPPAPVDEAEPAPVGARMVSR